MENKIKIVSTTAAIALSLAMFVSPLSAQENLPQCCALVELNVCYDACFDNGQKCPYDPTDDTCEMFAESEVKSCEAICREHAPDSCGPNPDKLKMKELLSENLCTMKKEE